MKDRLTAMTLPPEMPEKSGSGTASRQNVLLVLGMHRSGTSALTRMLNLLGGALPRTLMPAHESNATGHWESAVIADLNDGVLAAAGSAWDDWLPLNPRFTASADAARWHDIARARVREEFGDAPLFVLKDPRICRLVPFWREVLAADAIAPVVLMPLRNPVEVAQSLVARNGMDEVEGLLLWLRHVLDAEAASRDLPRVFLTYDQVLDDWAAQAERIASTLNIVWPRLSGLTGVEIEAFLAPDLRHHQASPQDASRIKIAAPWVAQAYAILRNWAETGERSEDLPVLDRLRAAFDDAGPILLRPFLTARKSVTEAREAKAQRDVAIQDRDDIAQMRDTLTSEHAGTREEYAHLNGQLAALEVARTEVIGERDQALNERQTLQRQIDAMTAERETLMGTHDVMIGEQSQLREELAVLVARTDALESERADLNGQLAALEVARTEVIRERDQALNARQTLQQQIDAMTAERETLMGTHDVMIGEQSQLREELAVLVARTDALESERVNLAHRLDGAVNTRKTLEEALAGAVAERDALLAEREILATQLLAEQELAGQHWTEARQLDLARTTLAVDNARLAAELAREQLLASGNWEERCRFAAETGVLQQALDRADRDRADLRDRLATEQIEHRHALGLAENRLRQRDEQIAQTDGLLDQSIRERDALIDAHRVDIAEASARLAVMTTALEALQQTIEAQSTEVAEAVSQLSARTAELDAMHEAFASLERIAAADIRQRDTALIQERWRRDSIDTQRQTAIAELEALREQLSEAQSRPDFESQLAATIAERDGERVRFAETLAAHAADIAALNRDFAARAEEIGTLNVQLDRSRAAIEVHERARQIATVLVSAPWWWAVVPTRVRFRWLEGRLARRGLFDAQAYRERYSDVAQSGVSPVLHFLRHGLAEGREG